MVSRVPWILLAAVAAAPAPAADLYRCVSTSGAVSFQDAPCADGSRLSRTIPVVVDPRAPAVEATAGSRSKVKAIRPARARSGHKADARDRQRVACEQARKQRAAALDRMGLKRTYDKLQSLDGEVQAVCKGL